MKMEYYKLCDICDFQGGSQPPKEEWSLELKDGYIRMLQIRDFTQSERTTPEYIKITNSTKICEENDILIARYGASLGKILTGLAGAYNVAIMKTIPNIDILEKKYLYYYLKSPIFQGFLLSVGSRAAQAGFNKNDLKDLVIPNISKEKQREIVSVLEMVEEIIISRQRELLKLDELIKARFVELFGLPVSNTKGWKTESMSEVAPAVNYTGKFDDEVWLLNLDMVESQTGKILDYLIVSEDEVGNSTCTFDTSNVLYSKLRPYLNKVVIPDRCGYATSELVPLQPVKTKINREYLAFMLRSDEFVAMINEKVAGAKMPRVSMGDFRKFDVPVPPLELQEQFATFVQQVDKSKVIVQKALDETQLLFDSLMQNYFG